MSGPASAGERFVAVHGRKSSFRDAHERRSYARAIEIAKRLVDDPSIVRAGEAYLEQHVRPDPHQDRYYRLWRSLLAQPAEEIAAAMLEDSDRGSEIRNSAPVFVVLSGA